MHIKTSSFKKNLYKLTERERKKFQREVNKITVLLQESQSEKNAMENKQKRLENESIEHGNVMYQLESERDEIKLKYEGKKRECERTIMELSKLNQIVSVFKNKNCSKNEDKKSLQEPKYEKDRIPFLPTINCEGGEPVPESKIFQSNFKNKNGDVNNTQKEKSIQKTKKSKTSTCVHLKEQSCNELPSSTENTVPGKGTKGFPHININDPEVDFDSFPISNDFGKQNKEVDDKFAETSNWPP